MRSPPAFLAWLIAAAAAAAPVAAQDDRPQRSAEISDVHYQITFNDSTARRGVLQVAMTFEVGGSEPVLLSLPRWTPGAYEISDFARWVSNFTARSGERALRWDKVDPDTWRLRPDGVETVTVSFEYVADTLDNAMAWATDDFALFNGTTVFLYPEGRDFDDYSATVRINTEPNWLVATGMSPGEEPRTYVEENYHDLVDMPFFVGRFDYDSTEIGGRWVRLATYPAGSLRGPAREATWRALAQMFPPMIAVWDTVPFETYTIMQLADPSYAGASGLEHQNSHVDVVTPLAVGNPFLHGLFAHEIFHAWNVKRLRPADLVPYSYDRRQPTPLLWVSEGITDYYADLALVRGGLITPAAFYALTAAKIQEVQTTPAVALEDASLSTWIHPTDGTAYVYYAKGSLAGLLLDILIRDASDNQNSLDDVLAGLYRSTYEEGRGFTEEQFWDAVGQAAGGRSFAAFDSSYVDGSAPYPWNEVLPLAGMRLEADTIQQARLGIATLPDSGGVRVVQVVPGSSADEAGVMPDDYLLSVGDVAVEGTEFGAAYRDQYSLRQGEEIEIVVRRRGETVTLHGVVDAPSIVRVRVVPDPNASVKARRIRDGVLRGE